MGMGSIETPSGLRDTKATEWTITLEGTDSLGQVVMIRRNGKPYTRALSISEARHLLREYRR